ncbi:MULTISPECIES: class I SAM-dependent methyltransferase [Streptomyces]|uniref:Class I SAM-dependent methyltransferase n=2 Tax=Streptomyces TaxID=1883 RepID=A0A2U9NXJ8_STRAS|nr:class I SAM-dependent methyltransferase [Streptomyces actuosus]AWT41575.1 class I SAM-dependent methyltransferase [Streptomyces actuosus]MBM4825847.1 class I SAM-dependent methyltransferase [Streptomyces actuosus]
MTETTPPTAAEYWDAHWRAGRRYRPFDEREADVLRRQAGPGAGRPALDLGCGEGDLAAHLLDLGYAVTAVDWAPTAVAAARRRHPGLDVRRMDVTGDEVTALPHPAYALITCRLLFRWIPDKPAFLARVRALLAPGGLFWVGTPVHDPARGERRDWELGPAETELLTADWSRVDQEDLDGYRCFALRP